ncbi:hypothetical protein AB6A40_011465 [Gnathostoma spinigerum]|uniref:SEA domain-containing protein n=1 Tax=Gnathostoma spinigerum TaxID=75299 RepID=A0ABD6EXW4_9BILA
MALSLFTALSLAIVYRITINFSDIPYSPQLARPGSEDFLNVAQRVNDALQNVLKPIPGSHRVSVLRFRYHQVIGSLVTFDIYSDSADHHALHHMLKAAIAAGHIGNYAVGQEGFEFHVLKGAGNTRYCFLIFILIVLRSKTCPFVSGHSFN